MMCNYVHLLIVYLMGALTMLAGFCNYVGQVLSAEKVDSTHLKAN